MSAKGSNQELEEAGSPAVEPAIKWTRDGILTLIGGFMIMLYLGCFFLWGNISVYVLSYFHSYNPDASFDFVFIVDSLLVLFNLCGYQIGTFLF